MQKRNFHVRKDADYSIATTDSHIWNHVLFWYINPEIPGGVHNP